VLAGFGTIAMAGGDSRRSGSGIRRWLPVAVLVALMGLAYGLGLHKELTLKTIGLNYKSLMAYIDAHFVEALLLYTVGYVLVVALSLPGALVMTLSGGLLFGWKVAAPATVIAATIGATIVFLVARSSCGEALAARAGPWLGKLRDGFKENALSYLLFLRLVPVFPFVVVNLAPALLGVPLHTYLIGTFLGIIPGTVAFTVAGAGLGSVIDAQNVAYKACLARMAANPDIVCSYHIKTHALLTPEVIAAFVLLGVVALIPVAVKKWSNRDAAAQSEWRQP
jgi:uncharacterized membrane protein YdjX (TVP38/TMEM64 family)